MSTSSSPQQIYPPTEAWYSPTLDFEALPYDAGYKLEYLEDVWSPDTPYEYLDDHGPIPSGSSATNDATPSPPTSAFPSIPSSRVSTPSLSSGCKRSRDSDSDDDELDVYPMSDLGAYLAHNKASPSSRKRTRLWSEALPVPGYIREQEHHNQVLQHYSNTGCILHTNTQPEGFQMPESNISVVLQINSFFDQIQEDIYALNVRLRSATQIHTPTDPEISSDRTETGLEDSTSLLERDNEQKDTNDDEQGEPPDERRGDDEGGQDEGAVFLGPAFAGSAVLVDGFFTPVATPRAYGVKRSRFDATACTTDTSATSPSVAREDDDQANTKGGGDDLLDEFPVVVTYTKVKDILNMYPHACIAYVPRHRRLT